MSNPSINPVLELALNISLPVICEFEGFSAKPYLDPVLIPTIGYGTIMYPDGRRVSMKDPAITKEQAIEYLKDHVREEVLEGLNRLCPGLNANQYAALISFIYNLGLGAFKESTLLKMIQAGQFEKAADQFLRWNRAGGKVLSGLTRRREAERKLFLAPVANNGGSPQSVNLI